MFTIQIHDEQLAQRLRQIAERENRPVEDVLRTLVEQYPGKVSSESDRRETNEAVKRVRRNAYVKARRYWQSAGDTAKAALTDEELDEQFGVFDEEGVPRLKSELESLEPPVGSLAYAAKIIREMGGIETSGTLDASKADDILNDEFADYLLKRMSGEDDYQQNTRR
jgi:hypothetical protein